MIHGLKKITDREARYIAERDIAVRRAGGEAAKFKAMLDQTTRPSGAIGLALSGGGLRSARINLGVLQRLQQERALQSVDYISAVSGGSYIAGWFTSHLRPAGEPPHEHPRGYRYYVGEKGYGSYVDDADALLGVGRFSEMHETPEGALRLPGCTDPQRELYEKRHFVYGPLSPRGGKVDKGFVVDKRSRATRSRRQQLLDEDLAYAAPELDRSVVVPSQIRTVLQAFKDALESELFPGRTLVPKTLIFAKDDSHAEDIVHLVREVFGRGNDFAKKITYRAVHAVTGQPADCEQLIREPSGARSTRRRRARQGERGGARQFRLSPQLRIAITVDMIATGTDITAPRSSAIAKRGATSQSPAESRDNPLEVLLFLRDVRSRVYFEQMKGTALACSPRARCRPSPAKTRAPRTTLSSSMPWASATATLRRAAAHLRSQSAFCRACSSRITPSRARWSACPRGFGENAPAGRVRRS